MNLPELSVKRPVAVSMIILILMVLGFISFTRLGLDFFPDLQFPEVAVITTYPGASSEEIETLITRPLEESVATVSGVKKVKSSSREGVSLIQAELDWGSNLDLVAQDVRNMMDIAYDLLPDQVERPLVVKTDFDLMPVLYYGVFSSTDRDLRNLRKLVEDQIEKRLETLPGVAAVTVAGGREREILVEIDRSRLEAHNLSLDDVIRVIRSQNQDIPGGHIIQGTREYVLRTIGTYRHPDQIANTIVTVDNGKPVYIRDVALVRDLYKEIRNISRTNHKESLIMWVTKESGANSVTVVDTTRRELARIMRSLPPDIQIVDVWDTAKIIRDSVRNLGVTVRWGALITIIVIFAFLSNVRATLTLAVSIPFAIITTFIGVYFAGYTLNVITLSGIALGVGMIVDNSIVVIENIFRHIQGGEAPRAASSKGAAEVSLAITASTFTSVIVFIPFLFATGLAGEMTKPLGLTVTFSLLASLVISITIVPMIASRFLSGFARKEKNPVYDRAAAYYRRIIGYSLRHRFLVMAGTAVVFIISLGIMAAGVSREYIPRLDEIYTTCVIKLAPGTSLQETDKFVTRVEQAIAAQPEFRALLSNTGLSDTTKFDVASGAGPTGVNESQIFFEIAPKSQRTRTSVRFLEDAIADIPMPVDGSCYFMQTTDYISGGGERPIVVNIFGSDLMMLRKLCDELEAFLRKADGVVDVDKSLRLGKPELKIDVDREKASLLGITAGQVADIVDASFLGRKVTKYREAGDEYDIRVRFSEQDRTSMQNVRDITIPSPMGFQLRLTDIATVNEGHGPIEIKRENQERKASVSANYSAQKTDLARVRDLVNNFYTKHPLPEGYYYRFGGSIESMEEMSGMMLWVIGLIILLVYMVMAAQFESFAHPLAIMISVPLALIGISLGLWITGLSLSVMSFIGIVILVGIVVNNGIVYIDYVNSLRAQGIAKHEALMTAGTVRLRPILMTTLTTVFGLIPMALSRGEGSELFVPIAVTLFGGLITSTFLTLVILPSVYSLIDSAAERAVSKIRRLKSPQA